MEFKYDLNDYKIEVKNQKMFKINDRSNIFHLILKEEKRILLVILICL